MNQLAPLVAAVARDEVLHDLQEDNAKLRNKIHRLETESPSWTIQITGPEGSPVYSTGHVTEREVLKEVIENAYEGTDKEFNVVMKKKENCQLYSFRECQLVLTTSIGQVIVKQIDDMNGHAIEVDNRLLQIDYGYSHDFWDMDGNDRGQNLVDGNLIIFSNIYLTVPIPPDHVLDPELQNRQAIITANQNLMVLQDYLALLEVTTEDLLSMVENTVNRDTPITIMEVHVRIGDLIRTLP